MNQMICYLTEHCIVCNIIFQVGNDFECIEIRSNTKISQAHLLYASFSTTRPTLERR